MLSNWFSAKSKILVVSNSMITFPVTFKLDGISINKYHIDESSVESFRTTYSVSSKTVPIPLAYFTFTCGADSELKGSENVVVNNTVESPFTSVSLNKRLTQGLEMSYVTLFTVSEPIFPALSIVVNISL